MQHWSSMPHHLILMSKCLPLHWHHTHTDGSQKSQNKDCRARNCPVTYEAGLSRSYHIDHPLLLATLDMDLPNLTILVCSTLIYLLPPLLVPHTYRPKRLPLKRKQEDLVSVSSSWILSLAVTLIVPKMPQALYDMYYTCTEVGTQLAI